MARREASRIWRVVRSTYRSHLLSAGHAGLGERPTRVPLKRPDVSGPIHFVGHEAIRWFAARGRRFFSSAWSYLQARRRAIKAVCVKRLRGAARTHERPDKIARTYEARAIAQSAQSGGAPSRLARTCSYACSDFAVDALTAQTRGRRPWRLRLAQRHAHRYFRPTNAPSSPALAPRAMARMP